jgi:hypothetical protein
METRNRIFEIYRRTNGVDPAWNGVCAGMLANFLKSVPTWTQESIEVCLTNRFASEVNHAEAPSCWIHKIGSYLKGPVDRFGQRKGRTATLETELKAGSQRPQTGTELPERLFQCLASPMDQVGWDEILDALKSEMDPQNFETWVWPTRLLQITDKSAKVHVPGPIFAEWLEEHGHFCDRVVALSKGWLKSVELIVG